MRCLKATSLLALALAGCGHKQLALPDDPIDRAATCGVVAASKARMAVTDVKAPLPFEAQLGVLHYAMLAGTDGDDFSKRKASATSKRMADLADTVTSGKWQKLEQPCAAAYPATAKPNAALPAARTDQQMQCFVLADFLQTALQSDPNYGEQLNAIGDLRRGLDTKLGAHFAARGETDADEQKGPHGKALAAITKAGPPARMLTLCEAKFPPARTVL